MYCKKCGGKVESYASHCPFCGEAMIKNDVMSTYTMTMPAIKSTHKSIGSWIGSFIISMIPIVGIIMLFVWAFSKETTTNLTFRNWARAQLILMLVSTLLGLFFGSALIIALAELLNETSVMEAALLF